jgi:hypothetical protein
MDLDFDVIGVVVAVIAIAALIALPSLTRRERRRLAGLAGLGLLGSMLARMLGRDTEPAGLPDQPDAIEPTDRTPDHRETDAKIREMRESVDRDSTRGESDGAARLRDWAGRPDDVRHES